MAESDISLAAVHISQASVVVWPHECFADFDRSPDVSEWNETYAGAHLNVQQTGRRTLLNRYSGSRHTIAFHEGRHPFVNR